MEKQIKHGGPRALNNRKNYSWLAKIAGWD